MYNFIQKLWAKLKTLLGIQDTADLVWLAINQLITPDVQNLITALIREAAQQNLTSAEKKQYVMARLGELQQQMRQNVVGLYTETLSTAVNLLVEYLQMTNNLPKRKLPA